MKNPLALLITTLLLTGCQTVIAPSPTSSDTATSVISTPLSPEMPPTSTPVIENQSDGPQAGDKVAIIDTDFGTIKVRLFAKGVPTISENFMELAKAGKYTNIPFHRVIKNFMIQGGDFTKKNGTGGYSFHGPDTYLANEINPAYKHLYGTISMAKSGDPVSIGSQFFIVTNKAGADFLDNKYSPFGQVYEGMPVAEKIQNLQSPGTDAPSKLVNVKKVTIMDYVKK